MSNWPSSVVLDTNNPTKTILILNNQSNGQTKP